MNVKNDSYAKDEKAIICPWKKAWGLILLAVHALPIEIAFAYNEDTEISKK